VSIPIPVGTYSFQDCPIGRYSLLTIKLVGMEGLAPPRTTDLKSIASANFAFVHMPIIKQDTFVSFCQEFLLLYVS
jgi:hypothetical protein